MPRTPRLRASASATITPHLGLVCQTRSDLVRFRTITRTRYLALSKSEKTSTLRDLYRDNLRATLKAIAFCQLNDVRLYRAPCSLFPMSDEQPGDDILRDMADDLAIVGRLAKAIDQRIVMHPDQFVVLSSARPEVIRTSVNILAKHALAFDLMGLPMSPWSVLLVHGGASGRAETLRTTIGDLPDNIRRRLALENDEHCYSADEILDVCRATKVPMVFDAHHHVIHDELDSYDHPSVAVMTEAAGQTWPDPIWQMVHISNGIDGIADSRHSDLITEMPKAFRSVPWIEVEAKGKEDAIIDLRRWWLTNPRSRRPSIKSR